VPPFYRKGFSSPDLSSSSPADRPASPTDRQPPRIHAAIPPITSPTSSAESREGDFRFDEQACKWLRHDHAGIPKFRPAGCNPGDPPPTWSYLEPLTRPAEPAAQSISAVERSVVECAWRWVPSSRPPAASFQNKSFGRPWGGFLGAPRLKALSSSQWGIALVGLTSGFFRKPPDTEHDWRLAVTDLSVPRPSRASIAAIPEPFRPLG
jgi:hypothetical protein